MYIGYIYIYISNVYCNIATTHTYGGHIGVTFT